MSNTQTIPWTRISVEAAAIVASILLAFSIDAWWSDREAQRELELELTSVIGELQDNRSRVVLEIAVLGRITSAGSELLDTSLASNRVAANTGRLFWRP
jgi:hypothetical protein